MFILLFSDLNIYYNLLYKQNQTKYDYVYSHNDPHRVHPESAHNHSVYAEAYAQVLLLVVDDLPGHIGHERALNTRVAHVDRRRLLQILFSKQHNLVQSPRLS